MRTLDRNKRNICYALCRGKVRETDRNGDFTGDDVIIYTRPVLERLNYSETRGRATLEGFGIVEPYTVTVVTDLCKRCSTRENLQSWTVGCVLDTYSILRQMVVV